MNIGFNYEKETITGIRIIPSPYEDINRLYEMSKDLIIHNPAVKFSRDVKLGKFNDYSDAEYNKALDEIRAFSELFKDYDSPNGRVDPCLNVFELLERLLYFYLRHIDLVIKENIIINPTNK